MDKKLINEDIQNMKYLFGYKPGRVISEQDIDYTTDDYLGTDEIDEDIFDGWDDPDNFKSERIGKIDKSEDDDFDDLEDFGDFGIDDDEDDFEWLPDEDNNHRDEMTESKITLSDYFDDVFNVLNEKFDLTSKQVDEIIEYYRDDIEMGFHDGDSVKTVVNSWIKNGKLKWKR